MKVPVILDPQGPQGACRLALPAPPTEAESATLWVGRRCHTVDLLPGTAEPFCQLSPGAAAQLHLSALLPTRLGLRAAPDGMHLGPVIGLLLGDGASAPTSSLLGWLAVCLHRARVPGLLYTFTMQDVVHPLAAVRGRRWTGSGFAEPTLLPLPEVVWKRGEVPVSLQLHLERLCQGHLFNRRLAWSKAEVQTALAGRDHILPACAVSLKPGAGDVPHIEAFLQRHGAAYLKPNYGSRGQGVARIAPAVGGLTVRLGTAEITGPSETVLESYRRQTDSQWGYLLQKEATPLLPGRPLDLRIVLQRGHDLTLRMTAACGRVAAAGHTASNLGQGGRVTSWQTAFKLLGLTTAAANQLLAQIHDGCIDLALQLEAHVGHIGEIGFDVAVDPDRNWWAMEANPRPDPTLFLGAEDDLFTAVTQTPLDYATAWAGY